MTIELDKILISNHHPQIYDTFTDGVRRIRPDLLEWVQQSPHHKERLMITEAGVRELVDWADARFDEMNQMGEAKTRFVREALNQWKINQHGAVTQVEALGKMGCFTTINDLDIYFLYVYNHSLRSDIRKNALP